MSKPKLLILNDNYPSEDNLYGDVFVHSRLKYYINSFDLQVLGYVQNLSVGEAFTYEGITVENFNDKEKYLKRISEFEPDVIGIHFVQGWLYKSLIKDTKIPIVIWVHGAEALGWYRRLYNLKGLKQSLGMIKANLVQLFLFNKIVKESNKTNKITFVFVSNWMKKIAESDTLSNIKNYKIIPNPIDTDLFNYEIKPVELRKKILLIRSFASKKYANDIAIDAIKLLAEKPFFNDLHFTIYGKGKLFSLTQKISGYKNVVLNNQFLENKNIPAVHKSYGIFLSPTRQDAQGVSMCEAIASGLVTISSDCTAIPEFIADEKTGFLTTSAADIAEVIEKLYANPTLFLEIAKNGSDHIKSIAGHEIIVKKEINLLKRVID